MSASEQINQIIADAHERAAEERDRMDAPRLAAENAQYLADKAAGLYPPPAPPMALSQLIKHLQSFLEEHGDMPVLRPVTPDHRYEDSYEHMTRPEDFGIVIIDPKKESRFGMGAIVYAYRKTPTIPNPAPTGTELYALAFWS